MLLNNLKKLTSLFRLIGRLMAGTVKTAPWAAGPLLGLAAYCPLYYFALADSWLPHLLGLYLFWAAWLLLWRQDYKAAWLGAWIILASCSLVNVPKGSDENLIPYHNQLKVAQVNVLQFNQDHKRVTAHIKQLDADVLAFQEVDQLWADSLVEELAGEYAYYSLAPQDNCYGMALFSRKPLKKVQLRFWEGFPAISALLQEGEQQTLILSLHAASPTTRQRFQARNKQLALAAQLVAKSNLPTLIIGDFNTVPWDTALKPLLDSGSLQDSRARHYTATWPAQLGKWGIPIDYVLYSPHWQRVSHKSVTIPGSDHKAMVATLALKPATAKQEKVLLSKL